MAALWAVLDQTERNAPDPETGTVVAGRVVRARSVQTNTVFSVFVPLTKYSVANVDTALLHELMKVDAVAESDGSNVASS
jgi:hypothetical protein